MGYLRRLPKFHYLAPASIQEACELLGQHGGEARLLAGGTDLILQMRRREVVPGYVIGLKGVPELAYIRPDGAGGLAIGAMASAWAIESSPIIRQRFDFLAQTALEMGSPEIRYVATIGGNLCGGVPCADFPVPLLTLGAQAKLVSRRGERVIPLEELWLGLERTALAPDELLAEIYIPPPPPLSGGAYLKLHDRHAIDITTTGAGAFLSLDPRGERCQEVRLALTTSAPTPISLKKAAAALRGQALTPEALEEASRLACEEAQPRTSWRASREFRLELIKVLTRRALRQAWEKAKAATNGGGAAPPRL